MACSTHDLYGDTTGPSKRVDVMKIGSGNTRKKGACASPFTSEVYVSMSEAVTSALASEALLETSLILTASPCATATACVVSSPEVALSSVHVIVLSAPFTRTV